RYHSFVSHTHARHTELSPFPTRRSSDLLQMNAGHAQQASPTPPTKEPAPPPSVTILGARDAHGVLGRDVRSSTGEDMGHIVDVIDRKSTRLNSSHQIISYAVFCLKKQR